MLGCWKSLRPVQRIGRSLVALWGSMRYQAEKWRYNWEKVRATLEDVRGRTALAIQRTIESEQSWWQKVRSEVQAHWTLFRGQARMTWDALRRNGLEGLRCCNEG